MHGMSHRRNLIFCFVLLLHWSVCTAGPSESDALLKLAAKLYPQHAVLQLPAPLRSSEIQAEVQQAAAIRNIANVLVIINPAVSRERSALITAAPATAAVTVDEPIIVKQGQSLVLATPAALATAVEDEAAATTASHTGNAVPAAALHLHGVDLLVVQCNQSSSGKFIEASDVVSVELLGLAVQDCKSTAVTVKGGGTLKVQHVVLSGHNQQSVEAAGGSLLAVGLQQVVLRHVVCLHNAAAVRGGCLRTLLVQHVAVTHSNFTHNTRQFTASKGGGAALSIQLAHTVTVSSSSFAHNTAYGSNADGGALEVHSSGNVDITDCTFYNNTAELHGGAVYGEDILTFAISNSSFTLNGHFRLTPQQLISYADGFPFVFSGGAVAADGYKAVNLTVVGCRFVDNAAESGGGVAVTQWGYLQGSLSITDCVFERNEADVGGGVFVNENMGSTLAVTNSSFVTNHAGYGGGAMAAYDTEATVINCIMDRNAAGSEGGALHVETEWAAGSGNSLTVVDTTFTNNTSNAAGGAMVVNGQGLVLQNATLKHNKAADAGGAISVLGGTTLLLSRTKLLSNQAGTGIAGGLRVATAEQLHIESTTVKSNVAAEGAGLHLQSVTNITMSNVDIRANTASRTGGGVVLLRVDDVTIRDSNISSNTAPLGAGLAADSSSITLLTVKFDVNMATGHSETTVPALESSNKKSVSRTNKGKIEVGKSRVAAPGVLQFASMVYAEGTAGAALLQRSTINLGHSDLNGNRADRDAGGFLMQQPGPFQITNTNFRSNRAEIGSGGGLVIRGGGPAAAAGVLVQCLFENNTAAAGSGGSAVYDSGIGLVEVKHEFCEFVSNAAAFDGGAVAAVGPTTLDYVSCRSSNNTAARLGGWLSCTGCNKVHLRSSSSSGNTAAVAGGSVSCDSCGKLEAQHDSYRANSAVDGGAVAVQATASVTVQGCSFDNNRAVQQHNVAAIDSRPVQLQLWQQLPSRWQLLYSTAAASSGSSGSSNEQGGSGGGLFVTGAAAALLTDNVLSSNEGSTGGAIYAAASSACNFAIQQQQQQAMDSNSGSDDGSCQLQVANLTAVGNCASMAGGVLYTSTPQALHIADPSGSSTAALQQRHLLQNNTANGCSIGTSTGGYGPGAASSAVRLSLLRSQTLDNADLDWDDRSNGLTAQLQQHGNRGSTDAGVGWHGRKLQQQQQGSSRTFSSQLAETSDNIMKAAPGASDATAAGVALNAWCPALGATILDSTTVAIDSNQLFSLPVYSLDQFGSQVTKGPGSDWSVALQQPHLLNSTSTHNGSHTSSSAVVQLLSAARGLLVGGEVVLSGLSIAAPPGSDLASSLTVRPSQANSALHQVLNTNIVIKVRPCLPGQTAVFSNSSSSHGTATETCYLCAAPSFSFTAYSTAQHPLATSTSGSAASLLDTNSAAIAAVAGACQPCPSRGLCVAGMVLPIQGSYMPHPRSTAIKQCPHTAACTRDASAVQNMQAYQCAARGILEASDIDARPFTALQCSKGYTGPLCSCCYRPGRNMWLTVGGQAGPSRPGFSNNQEQQQGYTIASDGVFLPHALGFDAYQSHGRSTGRCHRCPHILLAWLEFVLSRLLDMLLVALLALLWMLLGALATSPAAEALEKLKQQQTKNVNIRFGDRALMSKVSTTIKQASSELVRQGSLLLSPRPSMRRSNSFALPSTLSVSGRNSVDDSFASFVARTGSATFQNRLGKAVPAGIFTTSSSAKRQGHDAHLPPLHPNGSSTAHGCSAKQLPFRSLSPQQSCGVAQLMQATQQPQQPQLRQQPQQQQQQQQHQQHHQQQLVSSTSMVGDDSTMASPFAQHQCWTQHTTTQSSLAAPAIDPLQHPQPQQQQQQQQQVLHSVGSAHLSPFAVQMQCSQQQQPLSFLHSSGSTQLSPFAIHMQATQPQAQQLLHSADSVQLSPFAVHMQTNQQQQQRRHVLLPSFSSDHSPAATPLPSPLVRTPASTAAAAAAANVLHSSPTSLQQSPTLPGALLPTGHLTSPLSITYSTALNLFNQQQQGSPAGASSSSSAATPAAAAAAAAEQADLAAADTDKLALLLIAIRHLACMVQVLLDGAQIAAAVLAQDLMFRVPDWAAAGISAVVVSQYSTWQWVAFECLLPGSSAASGAAVQAVLVMVLPVLYAAVLLFVLTRIRQCTACTSKPTQQQEQQQLEVRLTQQSRQKQQRLEVQLTQQRILGLLSSNSVTANAGSATAAGGGAQAVSALSYSYCSSSVPFVATAHSAGLAARLIRILDYSKGPAPVLQDVQPDRDQHADGSVDSLVHSTDAPGPADSPFMYAQMGRKLSSASSDSSPTTADSKCTAAAGGDGGSNKRAWLTAMWALIRPQLEHTRALFVTLFVASMAYCFAFHCSTVVSAFGCMQLAGKPTVPGEVDLTASRVWASDMQLQCYTGQHMAVAIAAAFIGVPMIAAYWLLLLILAMPVRSKREGEESSAAAAAAGATQQSSSSTASWRGAPVKVQRMVAGVAASVVQGFGGWLRQSNAVAALEAAGKVVCRSYCIGAEVWNLDYRWWWLAVRECLKLIVLITVTVNSMYASGVQAPLVLLVVLLVAGVTWQAQPGCSTSMNWLLYIMYCLWQVLALLVLVLAIPGVDGAAFGAILLTLMCLVILNAALTLGSLVWRCVKAAQQLAGVQQYL